MKMRATMAAACLLAMISGASLAQQPSAPKPLQPQTKQASPPLSEPGSKTKTSPAHKTTAHKKIRAAKKIAKPSAAQAKPAAPPAAAQTAPPVPATLMNQPPVEPTVTLQNGLLTIDAPNSTLSEVLTGVGRATGAVIDEGLSPGERVAVRLGPGEPRQVIAALLEGTPYDYLILGSQQSPDAVTRIVLTRSATGPEPPAPPPQASAEPSAEPPQQPFQPQPGVVTGAVIEGSQPQPPKPPQPAPNQPMTPEQLFRQLQHPGPVQPLSQPQ